MKTVVVEKICIRGKHARGDGTSARTRLRGVSNEALCESPPRVTRERGHGDARREGVGEAHQRQSAGGSAYREETASPRGARCFPRWGLRLRLRRCDRRARAGRDAGAPAHEPSIDRIHLPHVSCPALPPRTPPPILNRRAVRPNLFFPHKPSSPARAFRLRLRRGGRRRRRARAGRSAGAPAPEYTTHRTCIAPHSSRLPPTARC
jgi:hypothetical protein